MADNKSVRDGANVAFNLSMREMPDGAFASKNVLVAGTDSYGIPTSHRLLSAAASVNATNVKASPGRVYKIHGHNAAGAARYLKLYNKASAPTVGTDTPVKTLYLAAGASFNFDWGALGFSFATGIGFGLTTGVGDADAGALTSGDVLALGVDYA